MSLYYIVSVYIIIYMSIVYMSCSLLHAGFNVQNRLSNSQLLSWFLAVCYSNPPFLWFVGPLTPPKSRRVLTRGVDHVPILHEFGIFSALRPGLSDVPWLKEYCWVSLGEGEAETTLGSPKYRACSHSFHSWKTWSEKVQLCSAQCQELSRHNSHPPVWICHVWGITGPTPSTCRKSASAEQLSIWVMIS